MSFQVQGMGLLEDGGVRVCSLCCIIDAPYYLTSSLPWLRYKQSLLINYSLDDFEQKNDSADPERALTVCLSLPPASDFTVVNKTCAVSTGHILTQKQIPLHVFNGQMVKYLYIKAMTDGNRAISCIFTTCYQWRC